MEGQKYQIDDTVRLQTVDQRFNGKDLRVDRVNASTHDVEVVNDDGDRMWINWDLVQPVRRDIKNLMGGESSEK